MSTPMPLPTWAVDGITLNAIDADGTEWMVTRDEGWYSAPGERLDQADRPVADGVYDGPSYRDARLITLEGVIVGKNRLLTDQALRRLAGICTSRRTRMLTVTEPDMVLTTAVKRARAPHLERLTETAARWQLHLVAPDPRRYGTSLTGSTGMPAATGGLDWVTGGGLNWVTGGGLNWGTVTSTGTVVLANAGTADAWPTFTISAGNGPMVNPEIYAADKGWSLYYTGTLDAGQTLTIDTHPSRRSVLLNGTTPRRANLTIAAWWCIPPASTVVVSLRSSAASTGATLTASWSPAWW